MMNLFFIKQMHLKTLVHTCSIFFVPLKKFILFGVPQNMLHFDVIGRRVIDNISISSPIQNLSDILFSHYDWSLGDYHKSQMNLRPTPPRRMPRQMQTIQDSLKPCVTTYKNLKNQVRMCNNTLEMAPCVINICRARIEMTKISGVPNPINLSNKNILINCQRRSYKSCMLDGKRLSSFFYGFNVDVTFHGMIFANGNDSGSGGALFIASDSLLNLVNCSFVNNSAAFAGAIDISTTTLHMSGSQSSFINNTGNAPALAGFISDLNLHDTLFEENIITEYVSFYIVSFLWRIDLILYSNFFLGYLY